MKNLWIKPEDQLPNIGEKILMYMGNKRYEFGWLESVVDYGYSGGKHYNWGQDDSGWGRGNSKPIAWQPLEAPEL